MAWKSGGTWSVDALCAEADVDLEAELEGAEEAELEDGLR
jgi:hypothetical protein